jgi:hypothetical protein
MTSAAPRVEPSTPGLPHGGSDIRIVSGAGLDRLNGGAGIPGANWRCAGHFTELRWLFEYQDCLTSEGSLAFAQEDGVAVKCNNRIALRRSRSPVITTLTCLNNLY